VYRFEELTAILIVKTSSLGDIVQSLHVLDYLKEKFPRAAIDWAVSKPCEPIVHAHPLLRKAIALDLKEDPIGSFRNLREKRYDLLFDLQGNCKSALCTLAARAKEKVGFGFRTAREWPAALAYSRRIDISRNLNIRLFNLQLIQRFFGDDSPFEMGGVVFRMDPEGATTIERLLSFSEGRPKIMVCPGSKWKNKQLPLETLRPFLLAVAEWLSPSFFLAWGSEAEKRDCENLREALSGRAVLIDKLPLPVWQNLMANMDLLIAVDSSALHLCATTNTPTFSLFGPTAPSVFKPLGERHLAVRGPCPYNQNFEKQCPRLRTCPTGACIKELSAEVLFESFQGWWNKIS